MEKYPSGTLMAVDDTPQIGDSYRDDMKGSRITLVFYNNPLEALKALEGPDKINPDVIISDIDMPEMDGFEFMAQVMKVYASE